MENNRFVFESMGTSYPRYPDLPVTRLPYRGPLRDILFYNNSITILLKNPMTDLKWFILFAT